MDASDKILTSIGLMSGTSLDGVDVALLRTDGEKVIEQGPVLSVPYDRVTKISVQRATKAALEGRDSSEEIAKATSDVTSAYIHAVQKLMEKNHLTRDEIDVIGLHGQTILHRPPIDSAAPGRTWQLGGAQIMADELRIDVVSNFRQRDMAHGGEGAPLAPIYHARLVELLEENGPVCVLNIGGVANITWVPADGNEKQILAFDCGPGNGLVDEWIELKTGDPMDKDGERAARGTVDGETVKLMALNPYLRRPAPKSLDRYDFKYDAVKDMTVINGAATLTAFTAACIEKSLELLPAPPVKWIVCGGGRHNPVLMQHLGDMLDAPVVTSEDAGWRGDFIEAECFAYLAVRSLKNLPISFPLTTRAPHPLSGGDHARAPAAI
jgi:anhydro-N-acetylmuramic acid kinase